MVHTLESNPLAEDGGLLEILHMQHINFVHNFAEHREMPNDIDAASFGESLCSARHPPKPRGGGRGITLIGT